MSARRFRPPTAGYSALEVLGALALLALGAAVIGPRVTSALSAARLNHAAGMIHAMRQAFSDFSGRYGRAPLTPADTRLDDLLVTAGSLAEPFEIKLGRARDGTRAGGDWSRTLRGWTAGPGLDQREQTRLTNLAAVPRDLPGEGTNYWLDGTASLSEGTNVASAVLVGLSPTQARELSRRIDGDQHSEVGLDSADRRGRVTYATSQHATRTVYVYLAHR